jgi:4-hydroxy-3-polyprenylbenzoate decarboxylase
MFGEMIHELTGPVVPTLIAGVRAVHAVDEAGVHPLLLAIGSERYMPFKKSSRPQELLTQANAILGQGQLSLAKYLLIVNGNDDPNLDIKDIGRFFTHLLERVDWSCDLHFQTKTTVDTLDYSGESMNCGSKVVIAARGEKRRELARSIPASWSQLELRRPAEVVLPGVVAIEGPAVGATPAGDAVDKDRFIASLMEQLAQLDTAGVMLVVVADDARFVAANLRNFLWATFTRSDPARDIHGVGEQIVNKHWSCRGPLIIDARSKPHHAPGLVEDPEVTRKVDAMATRRGPLAKYL